MEHTIDAKNKSIGRVASEAASFLMGKTSAKYKRHVAPTDVSVKIINAKFAHIPVRKNLQKRYRTYSGYPGGLKKPTMQNVIDSKGHKELFIKAVYGMLPRNKMRTGMMKRLTVTD